MAHPTPSSDDVVHSESFLGSLMRRQLRLSISCAATFLIALLGLPLANYFAPDLMATRVGGFTLTWLILGVLTFHSLIAKPFSEGFLCPRPIQAVSRKKTVLEFLVLRCGLRRQVLSERNRCRGRSIGNPG